VSERRGDWTLDRIGTLFELVERQDYRGNDPFDLANSPLLSRVPESWHLPHLVLSKFGSRVAPDRLRWALRVPPIEDPKIYAVAYFGYRLSGLSELEARADMMIDRLTALAECARGGTYWGYDFMWATRGSGVNPRGASTLVPGSFALLALTHSMLTAPTEEREMLLRGALDHYATAHRCANRHGEFLGYFPSDATNTHNANLLGCVALTAGGRLLGNDELLRIAASGASTTVAAVAPDGYIRYTDHPSGDWTDCFHHLYVLASVRAIAALNPHVDTAELGAAAERMESYYRDHFERPDGLVNYYPDRLHPIDPHNYAATAIYAVLSGKPGGAASGADLLERVDRLAWDGRRGRYIHRIHRRRTDSRFFLRWNQVWMLAALCIAHAGDTARARVDEARAALLAPDAAGARTSVD
jgi:hypothetical protein